MLFLPLRFTKKTTKKDATSIANAGSFASYSFLKRLLLYFVVILPKTKELSKNKFSFSLNHIAISVQDVNASVAFYQKVLQLKEIENTASNSKTRWLQLSNNVQLHLIPRPNLKVITNKAVHFAIAIKEIQPFINHLTELDIHTLF